MPIEGGDGSEAKIWAGNRVVASNAFAQRVLATPRVPHTTADIEIMALPRVLLLCPIALHT